MSQATLIGMALRFTLPASALLIAACAGGGGTYSGDFQDTQDHAPSSLDSAQTTNKKSATSNEGVATTTEHGGGGGGGSTGAAASATAGFNCLGTFKCSVGTDIPGASDATSKIPTVTLRLPGVCSYQGSGFNPDGTITKDGQVVGTWEVTSDGFKITETATASTTGTGIDAGSSSISVSVTLNCKKVSDSITDDNSSTPNPSTAELDAGVRQ